ncbi:MAG TPA: NAD-dependent epimerase/dehydratase family protein, partial [Anaerolineales bacterium]
GNQHMTEVNVGGTDNVLGLAFELGIPRTIYVSRLVAFAETGSQPCDESYTRRSPIRTAYEESKTKAHEIACQYQKRGLPLVIVCPASVIGANDHSPFGYFIRLYVNRLMPPICWSPNRIYCCVEVHDMAEGIALAAEKGRIGETYFLSGDPQSFRETATDWGKKPGAFIPRIWLPPGLVAALFAPLEPLQRKLGLAAFLSRDTVKSAATNMYYSGEKAQRELGWTYCSAEEMWDAAIEGEIRLLSKRKNQSIIQRLKPLEVTE